MTTGTTVPVLVSKKASGILKVKRCQGATITPTARTNNENNENKQIYEPKTHNSCRSKRIKIRWKSIR